MKNRGIDLRFVRKSNNWFLTKLKNSIPPIQIHTWGGYGSQLYGIYLSVYLESRYPFRRTQIVVHTSGVTQRSAEISRYKEFNTFEKNDFKNTSSPVHSKTQRSIFQPKRFIRKTMIKIGLLSESNTTKDLREIKWWVLALRGHYTEIQFDNVILKTIYELIESENEVKQFFSNSLGIHYRLGDLVSLENKEPIRPELIAQQINSLLDLKSYDIRIYSDSGELAFDLLSPLINSSINIEIVEATAAQTIVMLSKEELFIGTSSKISVWVAVFRSLILDKNGTYMPKSFERELRAHGVNSVIHYF